MNAVLFHQGDAPEQLLQVVSGLVRMTQINAEGAQTTLRLQIDCGCPRFCLWQKGPAKPSFVVPRQ